MEDTFPAFRGRGRSESSSETDCLKSLLFQIRSMTNWHNLEQPALGPYSFPSETPLGGSNIKS